MTIIPAIDLLEGRCVRLYKGQYDQSRVYDRDPAATAAEFVRQGAERIHLVDLGAARGGENNREVIRAIRKAVPAVIEVGGGIRSEADVEELLELGVDRLIVGTVLAREPRKVEGWVKAYGRVFIAGIDALEGRVKVSGWEEGSGLSDTELARQAADLGIISIIYTNIDRDGTLEGPDLESTRRIARESGLPVILSGGISGPADLEAVCSGPEARKEGIRGIITGKALYEGRLDLADAVIRFQKRGAPGNLSGGSGEEVW